MNASEWINVNQNHLFNALDEIRCDFYRYLGKEPKPIETESIRNEAVDLEQLAFENVCRTFGLNAFERKLLLLCAAVQLDNTFSKLCAEANGHPAQSFASFDLALRLFNHGQWLPFLPDSSLRYWRLLHLADTRQAHISALSIDEQVLHYITGQCSTNAELNRLLLPLPEPAELVSSHKKIANKLQHLLRQTVLKGKSALVFLSGSCNNTKVIITQYALAMSFTVLRRIDVSQLPQDTQSLHTLFLSLEREALFTRSAYYFELETTNEPLMTSLRSLAYLLKRLSAFCIVSRELPTHLYEREAAIYEVPRPDYHEQLMVWRSMLPSGPLINDKPLYLRRLLDQFDLDAEKIRSIVQQWRFDLNDINSPEDSEQAYARLWELCRKQCRVDVNGLVKVLQPLADSWRVLVLPEEHQETLSNIVEQVRYRHKVYQDWGFANGRAQGNGISALFAGASGTGKTLAARVIGGELGLDIYQIDLSALVSKYIGETEKNLEQIFCAAEKSGAILLFDEADALFGKRSKVQDSKDRYANMEVSYLLQRMESYSGLSVLTSNHRAALDAAFTRRLRFIVQFPFPQIEERARIWRSVFPEKAPTQKLDFTKLARLEIPGGTIRNIAVNAAFHAAKEGDVQMQHVLRATREEYAKSEKTLLNSLVVDW